ncbi:FtsW/RodA/SpoVE family cell cycle protein [Brassicibacter mesophilus]|uniref:FtsW/RodA/SpoVE family cell cycle protein n=1 Tax=Brassicibacter mesophilus TaxID=745119 RepID=UPI003D1E82A6
MIRKLLSYKVPQNLLVLINALALLLLITYNKNLDKNIIISGVLLIFTIYISSFILYKFSSGDHYIFLITTMLVSIGIIMVYRINPALGFKQIIWFGVGIIIFYLSYFVVKYIKGWKKWTILYLVLSLVLFLSTLILGVKVKGATNWIKIGGLGFQPSEIIKILFIFFLASYYTNKEKIKNKMFFLGIVYTFIAFLFIQKDLGTALLFYMIFITIFYVYEDNRKLILYNLLGASVLGILSYLTLNHVRVRVETWINPWKYIDGKGYQITQSLFAIASGGFFGTGLGLGHPEFIPEVHTDFIFSAICEEMGIFAGISIIMLFLIIVYRGIKITLQQQDMFFRIIALGITSMFGFQAFIILGGVIKMIPLTGITLPFVSYGGSSLVSSFIALGILQVASEELDVEQEEDDEYRVQKDN